MAKSVDKTETNIVSENKNSNISQVERAFKRLRVDESVVTHSNDNSDKCSVKSSAQSPRKCLIQEKRHSLNSFRRRFHSLSLNKEKNNCSQTPNKSTVDDNYEFGAKSKIISKDFSQINSFTDERIESSSKFCFTHSSKELSKWRNNFDDNDCAKSALKSNKVIVKEEKSCARQALYDSNSDASVDELAAYFDDNLYLPRKMSFMAEMMYT